ncbi:MAG TPA: putative ABC transporter permease [Clostridia bacterium]|nr:putative ABC transporter permease [Clostridia bacterium]
MRIFRDIDFKMDSLPYYFAFYSFLGWLMETVYMSSLKGTFIKRGFLCGPFCPIYGFGALLVIILLKPVRKNIFLLFCGSAFLTTLIELFAGIFLKLAFSRTWWSYEKEAFNLGGFICLQSSIFWGAASVILIKTLQPLIEWLVHLIPKDYTIIFSKIIVLYFSVDLFISINSLTLTNYENRLFCFMADRIGKNAAHVKHVAIDVLSALKGSTK